MGATALPESVALSLLITRQRDKLRNAQKTQDEPNKSSKLWILNTAKLEKFTLKSMIMFSQVFVTSV